MPSDLYRKFSGGLTGRPDLDAKEKPKYASEPWYRPPSAYYVVEDWDKAIQDYRTFIPEWRATFQKQ